ncbi:MAG: histidine kinase N-terminal 7TM domain-containing protein [Anaerolineae bacterium]|nr:histidine kinase N-terminal 7TM domain-containing protein [Anaerolineae bacterium]MDX9831149.1 histidine kinase N-terminal 7TM domain-containing protein [Anaerolineae bacterium]
MAGDYMFSPQIWPYLLTVGLCIGVTAFSWHRHAIPGARPLAVACLLASFWVAGAAAESMAVGSATRVAWFKFQVAWQLPAVTAVTCFVLEYANPGRWLTRRTLVLLSIPPLLGLALALTNGLHHWYWLGFSVGAWVVPLPGPGYWVLFAYGMGLVLVNLIAFAWLFVRSPRHRLPVALMLVGQIAARALHMLDVAGGRAVLGWDPFIPSLVIPLGMYAIALFGFRIFDPLPAAGRAAIEQMQEGVVVFDTGWRALSLNPAAAAFLGVPAARVRGRTWAELLPSCPDAERCLGSGTMPIEVNLGEDEAASADARRFTLVLTPLVDHRAVTMGYLLLLHDVTEQRRAQAQILEQQRALAMLQERERLARELHDSTGQVLGYVSFQAQAIAQCVRTGDTTRAEAQLARLTCMAQDAHADLRDSILSLRSGTPEHWSFLAVLEQYLAAYQENYGICAELILPPGLSEGDFALGVSVQLLRVIQEALTNARKHSLAKSVCVTLACEGAQATIVVADDGVGFAPEALPAHGQTHFGLAFMAERMAQIGGDMVIKSEPGAGTRVVLHAPLAITGEEGA